MRARQNRARSQSRRSDLPRNCRRPCSRSSVANWSRAGAPHRPRRPPRLLRLMVVVPSRPSRGTRRRRACRSVADPHGERPWCRVPAPCRNPAILASRPPHRWLARSPSMSWRPALLGQPRCRRRRDISGMGCSSAPAPLKTPSVGRRAHGPRADLESRSVPRRPLRSPADCCGDPPKALVREARLPQRPPRHPSMTSCGIVHAPCLSESPPLRATRSTTTDHPTTRSNWSRSVRAGRRRSRCPGVVPHRSSVATRS